MIERLKRRRDFVAASKGRKTGSRAFLLEALRREDDAPARFGFTVSKRTAKSAVERNRIRRRLREATRLTAPEHARPGQDYVLVGRRAALTETFAGLKCALAAALTEASGDARHGRRTRGQRPT